MPSKTSYFHKTLFCKNLSRYWPLWGMSAFFGALFPISALVYQLRAKEEWLPLEMTSMYYHVLVYVVPILSFAYAGLCAMAVWSYLYFPRSVGLMHTLPIRREGLFCTGVLSGLVMMAIPYAVTGGLIVSFSAIWGGFEPMGVLITVLGVAGDSLLFFGIATFCAFLVGHIFMLPALYILLNFLAVLIEAISAMIAGDFCFGLTGRYAGTLDILSPLVYFLRNVSVHLTYEQVPIDAVTSTSQMTEVRLEGAWIIAVYAAVGLALLAVSFFLYRRRRSESAGDPVSAPWMRPIFRYGYAALAALLGGRFLYALFWENFQTTDRPDLLPMTICMVVCACVGYLAASMVLAKSVRIFKRAWRGMVLSAAGCVVLSLGLKWDLFGIERRVPDPERIRQVQLYAAEGNFFLYGGEDDDLIRQVTEIHRAVTGEKAYVLDYVTRWERGELEEETMYGGDLSFTRFEVSYTLNNGRTLERIYSVPLVRSRVETPGTYDARIDALVNSAAMRQKRLRVDERRKLYEATLSTPMLGTMTLGSREYTALMKAVSEDAAAGRWGVWDWFNAGMYGEIFAGQGYPVYLRLEFDEVQETVSGAILAGDFTGVYLHPRMTATVAALKELGLVTEQDLISMAQYRPWNYAEDEAAGQEEYDRFCEVFEMTPEEYYRQNEGQYPEGWFDGTGDGWSDAA